MANINLNRQELENIYGQISPFEFKNKLKIGRAHV